MMSRYFFFDPSLMTLVSIVRVCFFCSPMWSCLYSWNCFFMSFLTFLSCFEISVILVRGKAQAFSLADFTFLSLDSLRQDSFTVVSWVCTFEVVVLKRWWFWGQWIFVSRTMMLDFRLAFGFYVNGSLHYLFKIHKFPVLLLHLYLNKKFKPFSKVADYSKLIESFDRDKFH